MDANSYIAPFNDHIHMFPDKPDQFTSIKKRTSMQVQSAKSEKLVKELKDAVMTTLPI
jgi:3-methyladenine DNA glycosylase Tag